MFKKILSLLLIFLPINAFALIEVDITRGNLNPLPLAVSPLSIDENSRKNFEKILETQPHVKEEIYNQICDAYILGYKEAENSANIDSTEFDSDE